MARIHLVSLGCPKNQVDSEQLLIKLASRNIHFATDPDEADVIVINTCGFIEAAKKESIDEILKAVRLKAAFEQLLHLLAERSMARPVEFHLDFVLGVGRAGADHRHLHGDRRRRHRGRAHGARAAR